MPGTDVPRSDLAAAEERVVEYMSRQVQAVQDDCSLGVAMDRMLASGRRHVVVLDPAGAFLGVLQAEAVTSAWMTRLARPHQTVGDLMAASPIHLTPDASMHTAASVMLTYCVDAVGVLEPDGRVVGILTWSDILRMVAGRGRP